VREGKCLHRLNRFRERVPKILDDADTCEHACDIRADAGVLQRALGLGTALPIPDAERALCGLLAGGRYDRQQCLLANRGATPVLLMAAGLLSCLDSARSHEFPFKMHESYL
jgi:hypothetical protein